jgi:flagellin-like hook-associated protein FlgL
LAITDQAKAASASRYMAEALVAMGPTDAAAGAVRRRIDSLRQNNSIMNDSAQSALGSLTDADLGRVSTARAQADTRQQLALDTIKTAISAYGNFAGGLLGNVQRTQQGVLA